MLCLRPGPVLFWTGRRSACPGAVDHAARLDRARPPWASCARRGHLPPRLPWAGPPGLLDRGGGAASAGAAAPGADQPTGPRDFPPGFRQGFSPVTRAPGDSPAHNARSRRSPRNALSINHRNMKSTKFMQVRLYKTVDFCNITSIFAKTLQISL